MTTYQGPVIVMGSDVEATMQADLSVTTRDQAKTWSGQLSGYQDADLFKVLTSDTALMRFPDGQEDRFVLQGKLTPHQTAVGVLGSGPPPF